MPSFVPDLAVILAFSLAGVILAITPGPDMALQLSRAINYGRAHGLACAAGAMTGVLVHTTLAALGISVLLIEHHVDLIMSVADRVTVLDYGVVIASDKPGIIQNDPRVIEAYFGVAPAVKVAEGV